MGEISRRVPAGSVIQHENDFKPISEPNDKRNAIKIFPGNYSS